MTPVAVQPLARRSLRWPGFFLGFALGGFFDGILLHQILQWHHLLSNVQGVRDMRWQIMADGLFHALMYGLAVLAMVQLWRRRSALMLRTAGRALWALALLGFGGWHMLDGVLSHWILGIHRVKVDAAQPLVWDLVWFVVFGVVPALVGWRILRKGGGTGGAGSGSGRGDDQDTMGAVAPTDYYQTGSGAAVVLVLAALIAGPVAALPSGEQDQAVVLFTPGITPAEAFNALARQDARVLWADAAGGTWVVRLSPSHSASALYREGAMLVGRSAAAWGCVGWVR